MPIDRDDHDFSFPLYVNKWDRATQHLTPIEAYAYFKLICFYIRSGGPLRNIPQVLAKITGLDLNQWLEEAATEVLKFFTLGPDNLLHQDTCERLIREAETLSSKRAIAGRRGAEARLEKRQRNQRGSLAIASEKGHFQQAIASEPAENQITPQAIASKNPSKIQAIASKKRRSAQAIASGVSSSVLPEALAATVPLVDILPSPAAGTPSPPSPTPTSHHTNTPLGPFSFPPSSSPASASSPFAEAFPDQPAEIEGLAASGEAVQSSGPGSGIGEVGLNGAAEQAAWQRARDGSYHVPAEVAERSTIAEALAAAGPLPSNALVVFSEDFTGDSGVSVEVMAPGSSPVDPDNDPDETKLGTRLPNTWGLSMDWRVAAEEAREKRGLPWLDLDHEADNFANYWQAKPGKEARKVNWRKTWINWAVRAEPPRAQRNPAGTPAVSTMGIIRRTFGDGN